MNFFDQMDRYNAGDELEQLLAQDLETHADADLGWPEGAVAAVAEHPMPEADDANL